MGVHSTVKQLKKGVLVTLLIAFPEIVTNHCYTNIVGIAALMNFTGFTLEALVRNDIHSSIGRELHLTLLCCHRVCALQVTSPSLAPLVSWICRTKYLL